MPFGLTHMSQSSGWYASGSVEPKSVTQLLRAWLFVKTRARKLTWPMPFVSGGHWTNGLFFAYSATFSSLCCAASA